MRGETHSCFHSWLIIRRGKIYYKQKDKEKQAYQMYRGTMPNNGIRTSLLNSLISEI